MWAHRLPTTAGRLRGSRNKLSEEVICALLRDFRQHGQKAVARVRQTQPAAYLKILALLVPREHKVEHSNSLKDLSDEQLEAMIEYIKNSLEAHAGGPVKVIEGMIEPIPATALPVLEPPKRRPNRLMMEVDTAIGPQERKPRKLAPDLTISGRDNWRFADIGPREHKPRAVPSPTEAPSIEAAPEVKRRRKLNRLMKEADRQRTP